MNGLIEDIKQGDRAAFRELFEDYYPILCVFAMKYIRDEEQCKDVAQETLLTYWQNRADFEDIFKVKGSGCTESLPQYDQTRTGR